MELAVRVVLAGAAFALTTALVTRWPHLLLARGRLPVTVLAMAAAAGAIVAPGAPTALPAVDTLLRAGLAAAVTVGSARARRQAWLFASTATVVAGVGAALDWLAFIATGVALALVVLGRRSWTLGAFIGACLSQVLLRLDLGPTTGTSAAVAAAVAGVLVVSGLRRAQSSTRQRTWIITGVLAGTAVVLSAAAALGAGGAAGDVRAGIDAGENGLGAARRGDVPAATGHFDRAADAFGRAGADLSRWWVRPALAVPVVGHQLRALRSLSEAGQGLAGTASTAASELDLRGPRIQGGAVDLTAFERAATTLASASRRLDGAAADVDSARSPWLLPPVAEAIGDLDTRMVEARRDARTAVEVLNLAGSMLGRDGPRRWFLAILTPAENRGSGGLIGNTGEITAEAGKLRLTAVDRIARLIEAVDDTAAARVLPSIYADAYSAWNVPTRLQNITVTPDFPTAAEALEAVLPLAGRGQVDGTIGIDPVAVAALLEAVGPVKVPSWPVPISAANADQVLLHEQYVALDLEPRENFLVEVINAVWERATTGDVSPTTLARALAPSVRGRHIQFHSRRAEEQATIVRLGADGAARYSAGVDHLALVTNNASESKVDWFLHRALDYRLRYDPGSGSAEATVTVTLTNDAPSSGLPAYVLGGGVVPAGVSRQIVQVYTPFDLSAATVEGRRPPPATIRSLGRPGNWAHEFDVLVPPESTIKIELRLVGRLAREPGRWILDLGRQPAIHPDAVTVTFDVARGWRIHTTGGGLRGGDQTATAGLQLDGNSQLWAELTKR